VKGAPRAYACLTPPLSFRSWVFLNATRSLCLRWLAPYAPIDSARSSTELGSLELRLPEQWARRRCTRWSQGDTEKARSRLTMSGGGNAPRA
jgi:hypothetical protein